MTTLNLDLVKHSGRAIPADYMAPQINPDLGNFTLVWILCSPLFLQTLGPWFPNEMKECTFTRKEDFGLFSNISVLFLLSPHKILLTLSLVQEWLNIIIAPFLNTTVCGGSCTDTSLSPCEVLLTIHCCLSTFSHHTFSFQLTLIQHSVNSHPFQQWPAVAYLVRMNFYYGFPCFSTKVIQIDIIKIISFSKSINMLLWNRSYQEKVFQRYNGKTQIAVPYMSCASDLYSILLLLIHYWAVNEPCSRSSWSIFQ